MNCPRRRKLSYRWRKNHRCNCLNRLRYNPWPLPVLRPPHPLRRHLLQRSHPNSLAYLSDYGKASSQPVLQLKPLRKNRPRESHNLNAILNTATPSSVMAEVGILSVIALLTIVGDVVITVVIIIKGIIAPTRTQNLTPRPIKAIKPSRTSLHLPMAIRRKQIDRLVPERPEKTRR